MIICDLFKLIRVVCKYRLYDSTSDIDRRGSYEPRDDGRTVEPRDDGGAILASVNKSATSLRGSARDARHPSYKRSYKISLAILCFKIFEFILYPARIFRKTHNEKFGIRLREAFKELGPIYIKFGQALSTAPTLVGSEVAIELRLLQDKLPAFAFKYVTEEILKSFGADISELFETFDEEPISAASVSQVHKAITKQGNRVAVKVLRPQIYKQYYNDIKFLYFLAKKIDKLYPKYKRLKLKKVVNVFKTTMERELNLKLEGASASELADNFKRDFNVYIPKIYWNLTSLNILTSEWIDGISIFNEEEINKLPLSKKEIATKIGLMFFNQAFRDGFFHADLHPGNILIKKDGSIGLVDFGIMGRLEQKDRLVMAEILFKFFMQDYFAVAKLHREAGYVPQNTDLYLFAAHCRIIYEPLIDIPFSQVIIADLITELFKISEKFGMETQEQLILLQKTMIVVEGIGRFLTPEVNLWDLAKPWIKKWAKKNISAKAKLLNFVKIKIEEIVNNYDYK